MTGWESPPDVGGRMGVSLSSFEVFRAGRAEPGRSGTCM